MEVLRRNWRRQALYLAVSAMELTWVYGWLLLISQVQDFERALSWLSLFLLLLFAVYATQLLSWLELDLDQERWLIVGLAAVSILWMVKVNVFPQVSILNPSWLGELLRGLIGVFGGLTHGVLAIAAGLFLWWRGLILGQQQLSFAWMRRNFRIGVSAFILLLVIVTLVDGPEMTPWLLIYFLAGLLTLALTRIEEVGREQAGGASPAGASWIGILAVALVAVLMLWLLTSQILAVRLVPPLLQLLRPVLTLLGRLLGAAFVALVYVIVWLLRPLIVYFQSLGGRNQQEESLEQPPTAETILDQLRQGVNQLTIPDWIVTAFQVVLVAAVLALILRWIARLVQHRRREAEGEQPALRESVWSGEDFIAGMTGMLRQSWDRLREAAVGRRAPWELYAADSVRRIYMSLLRLAAGLGYPRVEAETPYEYLATLHEALPASDAELREITDFYVRVRYGEIPSSPEELDQLQEAWRRIQQRSRRGGTERR